MESLSATGTLRKPGTLPSRGQQSSAGTSKPFPDEAKPLEQCATDLERIIWTPGQLRISENKTAARLMSHFDCEGSRVYTGGLTDSERSLDRVKIALGFAADPPWWSRPRIWTLAESSLVTVDGIDVTGPFEAGKGNGKGKDTATKAQKRFRVESADAQSLL
ncbi:hypothetical protein DL768_002530 [Monosporascus sp. mg162]|nr:hypothetical protein DL768_002530 [Monosporascus sp. mg162]